MLGSLADVVFAFPPATGNQGSFVGHLGVGYLRAALAEAGIKSSQYLNARPGAIRDVVDDLLAFKPGVVGFTAYDANFPMCLSIARSLKQRQSTMKIVFGGPSITFGAKEVLARHQAIDLCILGESEETGPPVFRNLLDGTFPQEDQVGVAFRREGKVICTPDPPLVGASAPSVQSALDITPSPYLMGIFPDGRTGVLTGRGCIHKCQYCCFAALGRRKVRLHSLDRVLAELEFIAADQKRSVQHYVVPIHDDTFSLFSTRAKSICETISRRGVKLKLSCITRADTVDDELLQLMRTAGFVSIAFGLESAVPSVLRATGKVRPPDWPDHDLAPERRFIEQVRRSVIAAKKLGFVVGISIILGLPTENAADGEATLQFVRTLPIDYYMHNYLWVFPGTPLWDSHAQYQIDCSIDEMGLPVTTKYAYDVTSLRPRPKCSLESDTRLIRELAADAIYDCEAPSVANDGISAVVIEADELTAATAIWLRKILSVGGIVLQIYSPLRRGLRKLNYDRDLHVLSDHLVPARYYVQLERKYTRAGDDRYLMTCAGVELYRTHKPQLLSITSTTEASPLLAWLRGVPTSCELCDVSPSLLRSPELASLKQLIDVESNSSPLQQMPLPPRIRYCGRWLKGSVSCRSLNRLEVDREGKIRCCQFSIPLGKLGDTKEAIAKSLAELVRLTERRRGCQHCTIAACPRCPFPGLDDDAYCKTMAQCSPVIGTLSPVRLYSRLRSTIARQWDRMSTG